MKTKELRTKSISELKEALSRERRALAASHFQSEKGRAKNVKEARERRRTVARILTILKEQP